MARFFIDRPIFAWVIAIVIMLAGGLSITQLSLEQYPDIAEAGVEPLAHYLARGGRAVLRWMREQPHGVARFSDEAAFANFNHVADLTA